MGHGQPRPHSATIGRGVRMTCVFLRSIVATRLGVAGRAPRAATPAMAWSKRWAHITLGRFKISKALYSRSLTRYEYMTCSWVCNCYREPSSCVGPPTGHPIPHERSNKATVGLSAGEECASGQRNCTRGELEGIRSCKGRGRGWRRAAAGLNHKQIVGTVVLV